MKLRTPLFPTILLLTILLLPVEALASQASLTATAGDESSAPAPAVDHERFVEIVRLAYQLLETYAAGPTDSLTFELSEFETVPREEFGGIPFQDLATLPVGRVIDVTPSRVGVAGSEVQHVRYIPKWSTRDKSLLESPEGIKMLNATLAEALAEISTAEPEYGDVYALTRYRVIARLDDEEREYVAAFFWLRTSAESDLVLRVSDHITQGVEHAMVEDLPTVDGARELRRVEVLSSAQGPPSKIQGACVQSNDSFSHTESLFGTHGHTSGNHKATANFGADCSCTSICLNKCDPEFQGNPSCVKSGIIWNACHKLADGQGLDAASSSNGLTTAPSCAIGYGCVYKPCLFCNCSLSVSVSANGGLGEAEVTFSASGSPQQTMNVKWTHECPLCEEDPDAEPTCPPTCTPIVIDMLGDGFRFTSGDEGVDFDIHREDYPIRVAWAEGRTDDVFLARDINNDAAITHGGELFGNRTAQPKSAEPNGYNALQVYDTEEFGGNEDGKIDGDDLTYSDLWVWHDQNHDGLSDWDELYTLEQAGIEAIYLDYWRSKERDRHGNELRYFSRVCLSDREDTLANRLTPVEKAGETTTAELNPLKSRLHADPHTLADTDCSGRIVQSTDVFFVVPGHLRR